MPNFPAFSPFLGARKSLERFDPEPTQLVRKDVVGTTLVTGGISSLTGNPAGCPVYRSDTQTPRSRGYIHVFDVGCDIDQNEEGGLTLTYSINEPTFNASYPPCQTPFVHDVDIDITDNNGHYAHASDTETLSGWSDTWEWDGHFTVGDVDWNQCDNLEIHVAGLVAGFEVHYIGNEPPDCVGCDQKDEAFGKTFCYPCECGLTVAVHPEGPICIPPSEDQTFHAIGYPTGGFYEWYATGGNPDHAGPQQNLEFFATSFSSPGTYTVEVQYRDFFSHFTKDCVEVRVAQTESVSVRYTTFIGPEIVSTNFAPLLYDYFGGDNRGFSYSSSQYRTRHDCTFDITRIISESTSFGTTRGYSEAQDTGNTTCNELFRYTVSEPPECSQTAVNGSGGNDLHFTFERIDSFTSRLDIFGIGYVQCTSFPRPGIDIAVSVYLQQECLEDGSVGPLYYKLGGAHDEFPWHELYINGVRVMEYNPCDDGYGPWDLWGGNAVEIENHLDWELVP